MKKLILALLMFIFVCMPLFAEVDLVEYLDEFGIEVQEWFAVEGLNVIYIAAKLGPNANDVANSTVYIMNALSYLDEYQNYGVVLADRPCALEIEFDNGVLRALREAKTAEEKLDIILEFSQPYYMDQQKQMLW